MCAASWEECCSQVRTRTGWFTPGQLADMVAISESTPGPMGVNTATYVGFATAGAPGGVVATLGLVCPSVIIILVIAKFLQRFRQSRLVDGAFYGLRAASVALITAAMLQVAQIALLPGGGAGAAGIHWAAVGLALAVFLLLRFTRLKTLHPICFIALSAVVGVVLQM